MNVSWYKDGDEVDIFRETSKKNIETDYSLVIQQPRDTDFGDYVCIVSFPLIDEKVEILHRVYEETIIKSERRVATIDRHNNNNNDVTFDCEYEVLFVCILSNIVKRLHVPE